MPWRKKQTPANVRNPRDTSNRNAKVFSYYSNRSSQQDVTIRSIERPKPSLRAGNVLSDRVWWIRYFPSLLSLILVIIAGVYLTTLSATPRLVVKTDKPSDTTTLRDNNLYQSSARTIFEASLLNRSKLTFDSDKMADEITSKFPELGEVVVTIPLFGRKPVIELKPSLPAMLYSATNGVYVIDYNGRAILKASELISIARDELPVVSDETGVDVTLGDRVLAVDTVRFINELGHQFKSKGMRTDTYILPKVANELHIKPTGKPFYIKFNTEYDSRLQAGTLFALLDRLEGEGGVPTEYIDVRVEERAFYK